MSERTDELREQAARYAGEAWEEWIGSVAESPASHGLTAIAAVVVASVVRWIV